MSVRTIHITPVEVRFGDTDMFGHVNNAAFATYIESARLAFFRDRLGATLERPGGEAGGIILARMAIDFRRQLLYGASAQVTTEVARIGRTSMTLEQEVLSDGQVVAQAETVIVAFDYQRQKPVEIPAAVRSALGFD
ncbi:MAG TPA: thioesterase family protein [Trueperaceae bacterium]